MLLLSEYAFVREYNKLDRALVREYYFVKEYNASGNVRVEYAAFLSDYMLLSRNITHQALS